MTRRRLPPVAAAALLLAACGEAPTPVARAVAWLAQRQRDDGMFVSPTYGVLARGESTTAAVALALARLPAEARGRAAPLLERALAALVARAAPTPPAPPEPIDYPCYTAALLLHALAIVRPPNHRAEFERLIAWLRTRQFSAGNSCPADAPEFGGFGLGDVPRVYPAGTDLVGLSVTTAVLEALEAAGVPADDPMVRAARTFVERCQSFGSDGADGGFCFAPTGDWRAGKAGMVRDANGRELARSYGSATADGVRALLACGLTADAPRVQAALRWFEGRDLTRVPGMAEGGDALLEQSLRLYWFGSLATLARRLPDHGSAARWQAIARDAVLGLQRDDGSFVGLGDAMKEDDPLVATALVLGCVIGGD